MFGDKLKTLRKGMALSMEDLAAQYNIRFNGKLNKSTLSRYENNLQEPMINVARNLADFFNVPVGVLTGDEQDTPAKSIYNYENLIPLPKMKKVPLLGTIACGEPILADENIEDYIKCPSNINADYALRCKGDSMINARIFNGDIVFVRQQPDVDDGEIAAVLIENEATLKRVYKFPNKIILRAENPMENDRVYTDEDLEGVQIIGKAIYFLSVVR